MRIRSVLAATVLGIALTAAGAATATADEGPRHHGGAHESAQYYGGKHHGGKHHGGKHHGGKYEGGQHHDGAYEGPRHHFTEDEAVCSPYFGKIHTDTSYIVWGGARCSGH